MNRLNPFLFDEAQDRLEIVRLKLRIAELEIQRKSTAFHREQLCGAMTRQIQRELARDRQVRAA